jgi:hypothetical protein
MSLPGRSHEQDAGPSQPDARYGSQNQVPPPKQIRFVSHDGQPYAKRRRVNTACQTCRKRKTRCSGERPECNTCTENGNACGGYGDTAQVRKTLPYKVDDDEQMDGEDAGDIKPSSGDTSNGDCHMPALHANSTGSNLSLDDVVHRGDHGSPSSNHTTNSVALARNRVPYFRYFGPTAIVPGFKQMVVQIRENRRSVNSAGESPGQCPSSSKLSDQPTSRPRSMLLAPLHSALYHTRAVGRHCHTVFPHFVL